MSDDEIKAKVRAAEGIEKQDDEVREKVQAKNAFENYIFQMRTTIDEPSLKDKISESDKKTIEKALDEAFSWLDSHNNATTQPSKEIYDEKKKEIEKICAPIISKLYGGAEGGMPGAGGMPGGAGFPGAGPSDSSTGGASSGPKFEDLD